MSQKSYFVETYGCQMNAHDSERIAGLLEDAGMVPVQRRAAGRATPSRAAGRRALPHLSAAATARRVRHHHAVGAIETRHQEPALLVDVGVHGSQQPIAASSPQIGRAHV